MIDIKIEGTKKKTWLPISVGSPVKTASNDSGVVGSMMTESARREAIVRKLAAACPYKAGDTVVPTSEDGVKYAGKRVLVLSVLDSYTKIARNEPWPTSDVPLIVHAKSYDKDTEFFCTTTYLKKKPADEETCEC